MENQEDKTDRVSYSNTTTKKSFPWWVTFLVVPLITLAIMGLGFGIYKTIVGNDKVKETKVDVIYPEKVMTPSASAPSAPAIGPEEIAKLVAKAVEETVKKAEAAQKAAETAKVDAEHKLAAAEAAQKTAEAALAAAKATPPTLDPVVATPVVPNNNGGVQIPDGEVREAKILHNYKRGAVVKAIGKAGPVNGRIVQPLFEVPGEIVVTMRNDQNLQEFVRNLVFDGIPRQEIPDTAKIQPIRTVIKNGVVYHQLGVVQ